MKTLLLAIFSIFTIVTVITSDSAAQTTYPLVCRFDGVDSAGWRVSPLATNKIVIAKSFKRSSRPATAGVPEGHCAWMDRGVSESEPNIIGQEVFGTTQIFEINYKGTVQLVTAPTLWAAMSLTKGYEIKFEAYQGTLPGTAGNVILVK